MCLSNFNRVLVLYIIISPVTNTWCIGSVQFSWSVVSDSLWHHGLQHARLPCSPPTPRTCSDWCPSSWWCHPTISSTVIPFSSSIQSFPASGSVLCISWLKYWKPYRNHIRNQNRNHLIGTLPMNIQDGLSFGLIGLIFLQSKELSRVFSNTTVDAFESINSSVLSFLYGPTLTSIHNYWKNRSFDYTDLCQKSNDV